jgi:hypothetical protein
MASFAEFVNDDNERENKIPAGQLALYSFHTEEDGSITQSVRYIPRSTEHPVIERKWTEPSPIGKYLLVAKDDNSAIAFMGRIYGEPTFGTFNVALEDPVTGEESDGSISASALKNWTLFDDRYDLMEAYENYEPAAVTPAAKKPFSFRELKDPRSYTFPPQKWIIPGWAGERLYTTIIAASGQGKSTLTLAMCKEISEGGTFLGHKVEPRPVLYLDKENSWGIVTERFERFRIKKDNPNMLYHGMYVEEKDVPEAGSVDLLQWIQSEPVKPLIVFDSLVRFLPSHNDSDQAEAAKFGEYMMKLTTAGAAVWVLHHSGKGESTKDGRGSADLTAQCDIKLIMEASVVTDQMKLRQVKVRQLKGRMHAEDCIPTGPDKPVYIDISPEGDLTLKAIEGDSQVKRKDYLTKQDEGDIIELMSKNPKFRLADLTSWANSRLQIHPKLTARFFKDQKTAGTISEEKSPEVGNVKLYTWVEPDHFRAGRNS